MNWIPYAKVKHLGDEGVGLKQIHVNTVNAHPRCPFKFKMQH